MIHFEEYITLADSLVITGVSLAVVFVVLTVIALIITFLGKVLEEKPKEVATNVVTPTNAPVQTNVAPKVDMSQVMNDEHKRIATLVATIAANENEENVKYRVNSIKEI